MAVTHITPCKIERVDTVGHALNFDPQVRLRTPFCAVSFGVCNITLPTPHRT
jgi:hypothetical protein